mgnify:CR=1 FL=1
MKKIVIDASEFTSKQSMYDCLHRALGAEDFFGSNLDALHDRLTMVFEPTELIVRNYACALRYLGAYADAFWHVLDDSAEENDNLHISFC